MTLPETVERIAAAVAAHPAVANLHGGAFGTVASYLPGQRINGVRVTEHRVELAIVVRFGHQIPAVVQELRATVRKLAGEVPVDVTIVDLVPAQQDSTMEDT